jgi:hypothetical protein
MAQQPYFKGIPKKQTTPTKVVPGTVAKQVFQQSVEDAKKGVQKEIPDVVLKAKAPQQLEARNKKREFDQKQRVETPIRVPTSHGDKWVKVAGWNNLTVDQKAAKRNALAQEFDDEMASQGIKPTRPAPPRLATSDEAVSEGSALFQNARDAVYGAVNQAGRTAQMVNPGLGGFEAFRQVGGNALSSGLRTASNFVKDQENAVTGNALKDVSGTGTVFDLLDPSKMLEGLVHTPSSILSSAANLVDPKTDTVGQIQSGVEVGANFLPGYLAAAKGIKVGKNLLKGGAPLSTAVGQGAKSTALSLLGNNGPDTPAGINAPSVANDIPTLPKPTPDAPSFQQFREGAKGADVPDDAFYEDFYGGGNVSKTQQVPQPETMPKVETPAAPVMNDMAPGVSTSARKAQVAEDRAAMGLDELDNAVRKSFGESLDNARTKGYDGAWATREAEAVTTKPRALNDEETAGMVDVMTGLKKQHKSVLEQIANETDPAKLDRLRDDLKGIEKQFDGISEAVKLSGTEKGRALASQKITLNEDFDLISVKSRAKAAKGADLSTAEVEKYDSMVTRLEKAEARINDLELKNVDLQTALDSMPTGAKSGRRVARTDVEIKAARADALAKIQKSINTGAINSGPGAFFELDYKAIAQYALTFAEQGVGKVEDVIALTLKGAKEAGIDLTDKDVKKALIDWGTPKKSSRELDAAIFQRDRLRKEIRNSISGMESTGIQKVIREASALPRALQATGDLSATLRQGLLLGAGNKRKAMAAFGRAMRAVVDPVYSAKLERELMGSPMAVKRKQAGLFIADGETLSLAEEAFMSKIAKEYPILKTVSGASERHYTTFLNQLRASVFDDMVKRFPDMGLDDKKALADFINVATGRGRVSPGIAETASKVFFSPRFMASRIEAPLDAVGLTKQGRAMWKSPAARFQLMKSWSTVIGSGVGLLSLAKMAGAEVSLDPDSPDFGKARLGDTSFDIWGGMQPPVRLAAKLAKQVKSGEKPEYKKGTAEEAMKFLRYKLAPLPNIIIGAMDKQDAVGQPYLVDKEGKMDAKTVAEDGIKTLSPLLIKDLASLWNFDGETNTPIEAKIAGSIAAPLGVGVSTYKRKS